MRRAVLITLLAVLVCVAYVAVRVMVDQEQRQADGEDDE